MNRPETEARNQNRRTPWATARSLVFTLPRCWGEKANDGIDLPLVFASQVKEENKKTGHL